MTVAGLLLAAVACEASAKPAPSSTPLAVPVTPPVSAAAPGSVDPAALVARVQTMKAQVLRVDRITAKLVPWDVYNKDSGSIGTGAAGDVWAVAVLGSIHIDSLLDLPNAECAVYAFDAQTGDVRAFRAGPASVCAPYFER